MADRLIYGVQAVRSVLRRCPERVLEVYADAGLGDKRRARVPELDALAAPLQAVDRATLDRLCKGGMHQGLAARVEAQEPLTEAVAKDLVCGLSNPLLLLLDGVQDPRNFGACLRTANAAGVDIVVVGRNRNVGLTPAVSKVAAGAAEIQPVAAVANLARTQAHAGMTSLVVMPLHRSVRDHVSRLEPALEPFAVDLGGTEERVSVWRAPDRPVARVRRFRPAQAEGEPSVPGAPVRRPAAEEPEGDRLHRSRRRRRVDRNRCLVCSGHSCWSRQSDFYRGCHCTDR